MRHRAATRKAFMNQILPQALRMRCRVDDNGSHPAHAMHPFLPHRHTRAAFFCSRRMPGAYCRDLRIPVSPAVMLDEWSSAIEQITAFLCQNGWIRPVFHLVSTQFKRSESILAG